MNRTLRNRRSFDFLNNIFTQRKIHIFSFALLKKRGQFCFGQLGVLADCLCNAVFHAVGVSIKELPITSEKFLKALKEKEAKGN